MLTRVENQPTLFQKLVKSERLKSMEKRYEEVLKRSVLQNIHYIRDLRDKTLDDKMNLCMYIIYDIKQNKPFEDL